MVVCDGTNNTGQVIDANEFRADIYIKPARAINFITLTFVATRTGVDFLPSSLASKDRSTIFFTYASYQTPALLTYVTSSTVFVSSIGGIGFAWVFDTAFGFVA